MFHCFKNIVLFCGAYFTIFDHISLLVCLESILKKEHQAELQTDEQHQIETKNMETATADMSVENYRTRHPCDCHGSVC